MTEERDVRGLVIRVECYSGHRANERPTSLWIDNEKIDVYEDGTFYAVIRLRKEGENVVEFLAQDPAGNEQRVRRRAYVETY